MCKPKDEGPRCASHTRGPARAAYKELMQNGSVTQEQMDDLVAFASTPSGRKDLEHARDILPDDKSTEAGVLDSALELGAARAEADKEFARMRKAEAAKEMKSTGKEGTDVPPLVAEIKQGRATHRFYATNPEDKELLESGKLSIDEALATGRAFPSITTCLGALDKPALVPWAAGLSAEEAEAMVRQYIAADDEERARLEAEWFATDKYGKTNFRKAVAGAYRQKRDKAADRGTEVHALAEAISKGENPEIPEELQGYVDAFNEFQAEWHDIEYVYTEATVINKDAGTMGTTDAIVKIGDKLYVLDIKTNKDATVYSNTGMQLAAAANADYIVYSDGRTEPMPEIAGGIGVGVGPDGKHQVFFFETDRDGENYNGFKAARQAWRWKRARDKQDNKVTREQLLAM